jgi:FdhE protein
MTRSERGARARQLAVTHPASAALLSFYADLVAFQDTLPPRVESRDSGVDCQAVAALVPAFLAWLRQSAPSPLAERASALRDDRTLDWVTLVESYWRSGGQEAGADDTVIFVVEAVLQPFAEAYAAAQPTTTQSGTDCPVCRGRPVVATLRERGHGARRALVCGVCLTEYPVPRVTCAACDETRFDALPAFRAEEFDAIRIDACDSCHSYLKTVDLTRNGGAIAVVDDLASVSMDLWAQEQGYRKIRPNALRL